MDSPLAAAARKSGLFQLRGRECQPCERGEEMGAANVAVSGVLIARCVAVRARRSIACAESARPAIRALTRFGPVDPPAIRVSGAVPSARRAPPEASRRLIRVQ